MMSAPQKKIFGRALKFFWCEKNFRPRRAPTSWIFGQNDPKIYRFSPKIDHFWTFSGLWSPKMSLAPWKFFWEHKITNFTPKKIFGRTGHPHAEISATLIFEICGFWPKIDLFLHFNRPVEPEKVQKGRFWAKNGKFWPKIRHVGAQRGRKIFLE